MQYETIGFFILNYDDRRMGRCRSEERRVGKEC